MCHQSRGDGSFNMSSSSSNSDLLCPLWNDFKIWFWFIFLYVFLGQCFFPFDWRHEKYYYSALTQSGELISFNLKITFLSSKHIHSYAQSHAVNIGRKLSLTDLHGLLITGRICSRVCVTWKHVKISFSLKMLFRSPLDLMLCVLSAGISELFWMLALTVWLEELCLCIVIGNLEISIPGHLGVFLKDASYRVKLFFRSSFYLILKGY